MVAKGTKFRVPDDEWLDWEPNLEENGMICGVMVSDCCRSAAVAEGFRRWAEKMTDTHPDVVHPDDLSPFLESVIKDVKKYFSKRPDDTVATTIPVEDALWLRRKLIITYCDKLANKFMFVCPKNNYQTMRNEISPQGFGVMAANPGTYVQPDETASVILARQVRFLKSKGITWVPKKFKDKSKGSQNSPKEEKEAMTPRPPRPP